MEKKIVEVYGMRFDLNDLKPLVTAIGYNPVIPNDVGYVGEGLYKTADKRYFLASEGSWAGEDFFGGGDWRDDIVCDVDGTGNPWAVPVTEAEAKSWAECVYIDADDFARIFGEESEILREGEKMEEEMRESEREILEGWV